MSAAADIVDGLAARRARRLSRLRNFSVLGLIATTATVLAAVICAFPLYWGLITTFKPEDQIVRPGVQLWPEHFTFQNYIHVLTTTKIGVWYVNSLVTSAAVTVIVVGISAGAGYAISQLNFPGRRIFWGLILASFMVPIPALIVTHFVLMSQFHWINTWAGVIAPQLIAPITVIIYKQFFELRAEGFPRGRRDRWRQRVPAALPHLPADELGHHRRARDHHLHRRLESLSMAVCCGNADDMMNITVGITQVHDAFGVQYGRDLAVAMLAALPVAIGLSGLPA